MSQAYLRGDVPIHAIAGAAHAHLGQMWHSAFRGAGGSAILIRSGNRAKDFFDSPVSAAVHLYVDTTALLTIHQLGLLDILDAAGLSLTFAHTLLPVLQALAIEVRFQQPSRIEHDQHS
jgi:spore maturation protein SpmA